MCIPTRTRLTYNNDKPWFTAKLRQLCEAKDNAYRKGDKVLYKQAKYTLETEIRVAKRNYSGKLRNKLSSSDSASVWKGLKDITNYKTTSPSTLENQHLTDDFNEFYCRFEKNTPHLPWTPLHTTINTSSNSPLPHTCTGNRWRWHAPGLQREQKEESTRTRQCFTSRALKPVLTSWPPSSQRAVRSPLTLQTLRHHPRPKYTQTYWT